MSQSFLETVKARRSYYPLKKESPVDNKKIQDIVTESLLQSPSSFNNQTTRILLLLGAEHEKFWGIVKTTLKAIVPGAGFATSEKKMDMFKGAYGTVLFFDDRSAINKSQEAYSIYADKFPDWATQTNGISQYIVWTALEAEGFGANLQHYNPIVNQQVAATWDLPETWELNAQLVFGTPTGPAKEKTFVDVKERIKVFGA
ncbi:putative nitroreductase HBN1 [Calycina marina]|uniref:Nitroreductase HBN1 n=1 Tax=Calycina marina TaxID=1763456 RepID=A0A9P8CDE6_9HELO|nr:putative nitroreductase HBN1 [Calycina marina]